MEKTTSNSETLIQHIPTAPMRPSEKFDSDLTAHPTEEPEEPIEYGTMNEADARESGYIDGEGHAVSLARKDIKGSPTHALTDIGAGRSGVVKQEPEAED